MPQILLSIGGLNSRWPCGRPAWCTGEAWVDWYDTAVMVRGRVIAVQAAKGETNDTVSHWLAAWAPGSNVADLVALNTEADPTVDKPRWERKPAIVIWRPSMEAMADYAAKGARLLSELGGEDLLTEEESPDLGNYVKAGAIGAALAVLGGGALYIWWEKD